MKTKTVFMQGSFDLLNVCHIKCFKIAHSYGDLIVGLNTDHLIEVYKGKISSIPYEERAIILRAIKYVDKVIPCDSFSPMEQLKELKPEFYLIGEDWMNDHPKEMEYVKSYGGQIIVTKNYTKYMSSSDIRDNVYRNKLNELMEK